MSDIIRKITDIVTIIFPALVAVFGVLNLSGAIAVADNVEQVVLIVLGALSAIASVIYNKTNKE